MRGKSCSMDGLPDFTPSSFYVPGERHENLPVSSFARAPYATMGAPVQTLLPDRRPAEYATGGSGMFQGADFGHGKLIALHGPRRRRHMGQTASGTSASGTSASGTSAADILSQALQTTQAVAQAVTPAQAAAAKAAAPAAAAKPGLMSQKIAGIPVVVLILAAAGAGAYFYMKKKR